MSKTTKKQIGGGGGNDSNHGFSSSDLLLVAIVVAIGTGICMLVIAVSYYSSLYCTVPVDGMRRSKGHKSTTFGSSKRRSTLQEWGSTVLPLTVFSLDKTDELIQTKPSPIGEFQDCPRYSKKLRAIALQKELAKQNQETAKAKATTKAVSQQPSFDHMHNVASSSPGSIAQFPKIDLLEVAKSSDGRMAIATPTMTLTADRQLVNELSIGDSSEAEDAFDAEHGLIVASASIHTLQVSVGSRSLRARASARRREKKALAQHISNQSYDSRTYSGSTHTLESGSGFVYPGGSGTSYDASEEEYSESSSDSVLSPPRVSVGGVTRVGGFGASAGMHMRPPIAASRSISFSASSTGARHFKLRDRVSTPMRSRRLHRERETSSEVSFGIDRNEMAVGGGVGLGLDEDYVTGAGKEKDSSVSPPPIVVTTVAMPLERDRRRKGVSEVGGGGISVLSMKKGLFLKHSSVKSETRSKTHLGVGFQSVSSFGYGSDCSSAPATPLSALETVDYEFSDDLDLDAMNIITPPKKDVSTAIGSGIGMAKPKPMDSLVVSASATPNMTPVPSEPILSEITAVKKKPVIVMSPPSAGMYLTPDYLSRQLSNGSDDDEGIYMSEMEDSDDYDSDYAKQVAEIKEKAARRVSVEYDFNSQRADVESLSLRTPKSPLDADFEMMEPMKFDPSQLSLVGDTPIIMDTPVSMLYGDTPVFEDTPVLEDTPITLSYDCDAISRRELERVGALVGVETVGVGGVGVGVEEDDDDCYYVDEIVEFEVEEDAVVKREEEEEEATDGSYDTVAIYEDATETELEVEAMGGRHTMEEVLAMRKRTAAASASTVMSSASSTPSLVSSPAMSSPAVAEKYSYFAQLDDTMKAKAETDGRTLDEVFEDMLVKEYKATHGGVGLGGRNSPSTSLSGDSRLDIGTPLPDESTQSTPVSEFMADDIPAALVGRLRRSQVAAQMAAEKEAMKKQQQIAQLQQSGHGPTTSSGTYSGIELSDSWDDF